MWQSTLLDFSNDKGVFFVSVQYSNGTDSFIESLNVSGSTLDAVTQTIQNKLVLLNANDDLQVSLKAPNTLNSLVISAPIPTPPVLSSVVAI